MGWDLEKRQGRHQRERSKPLVAGGALARVEDRATETAPRPVPADEHGSHPCGLGPGVEQAVVVVCDGRSRVELGAPAPPPAGDDLILGLVHEVRAVRDELHVQMGDVHRGAGGLPLVVEAREEIAHRRAH